MIGLGFIRMLLTGVALLGASGGGGSNTQAVEAAAGTDQVPAISDTVSAGDIDFGDDASTWAHDGECDDPRFTGPGMTGTALLDSDRGHDATDCRTAFEAGQLSLRDDDPDTENITAHGIDFGDDASTWANDGECDDKRFTGPGMTITALLDEDVGRDASDCLAAWEAGDLTLFEPITDSVTVDGIDFGTDDGSWPHDNQCDDPRFDDGTGYEGLESARLGDATDCLAAWAEGEVVLRHGQDSTQSGGSPTRKSIANF